MDNPEQTTHGLPRRRLALALLAAGVWCATAARATAQDALTPPANRAIDPSLAPPGAASPGAVPDSGAAAPEGATNRPTPPARVKRTVAAVEFVGLKRIERKKALEKVKVRAGHEFDEEQIERDVRELNRSGMFVEVRPKSRLVDDGVIVEFDVIERPVIQYLQIVGNDDIRDKKLAEKAGVKVGGPLSPYDIEEGRRKIEEFYRERGYNRVQVTILEGTKPTDKGVVYVINEGRSQKILWTSFVGNTIVSGERLKTQIQSKPGFAWIIKGYVDYKKIDEDVERLTAYYRSLGYFRAQVRRTVDFGESRQWMSLTFVIHEGERFKIRNVTVEGNEKIDTARLTKDMQLKAGEFFDQGKMNKDTASMMNEYGADGYVFADVKAGPQFDEEPGVMDLVYTIKEGDRYKIGEVNVIIEGESPHTKLNVVKNNVHLRPGDIADIREIRDSQRRLMRAGVFERQDPSKVPQIKFSRPEDGEAAVVGRGAGVRKVRGQSPDDGYKRLDIVVEYPPGDAPAIIHVIERGLPHAKLPYGDVLRTKPSMPARNDARNAIEARMPVEIPDAPSPPSFERRASYYDRPIRSAAQGRAP
jgi:outer membrane protein insertion porin family